jgi:tripartite-type tricarboxylate transporter receptor subunit TctC
MKPAPAADDAPLSGRRRTLAAAAAGLALAAMPRVSSAGPADTFPSKPVRIIVPFTPGGSTDILARAIGQKLAEAWGQPVVIENKPGAGGNVGVDLVAKSAPDGTTIVMGHIGTFAANPALYKQLPYDPVKDFAPITLVAMVPNVLVVGPAVQSRTLGELIAHAKANPGKLDYGSGGNGSAAHLATEYFKMRTGVAIQHVPYKGTGPAVADLLGGQIGLMITGALPLMPHIKSGKLRALAVASPKRLAILPDVPTIAESGYPGFAAMQWYGLFAPAATPKDIVAKINRDAVKALRDPGVAERLMSEGAEPVGDTPAEFGAFVKSEIELWGKVIRESGAKVE